MNLHPYIDDIHRQLAVAAEAGGEAAMSLAERLAAPLDAAIRLALQDVLAAAADEITLELAPGAVELRLRGRDPEFVVTPAPTTAPEERVAPDPIGPRQVASTDAPTAPGDVDDGAIWRINLRLPLQVKPRVEQAAGAAGLSVNSWLQRAVSAALDPGEPPRRERRTWTGGEHYTGWVR
ncbi:MAG TPA: hypothetical protein VFO60_07525 [Candidatus Dormibacteraeota bacterium]|nr:hypothetical protein [Candidatus Dormibacteraeota bacterium]